jgi:hypothetical protein
MVARKGIEGIRECVVIVGEDFAFEVIGEGMDEKIRVRSLHLLTCHVVIGALGTPMTHATVKKLLKNL